MTVSSFQARASVIALLKEAAARVARLEQDAGTALYEAKNEDTYRQLMREKATFLAGLPETFTSCLADAPPDMQARIIPALDRFAQGAATALSLNSVFYMAALLYPDRPAPGEPNNLELLVRDLQTSFPER
jgi:hypothetical protein